MLHGWFYKRHVEFFFDETLEFLLKFIHKHAKEDLEASNYNQKWIIQAKLHQNNVEPILMRNRLKMTHFLLFNRP